MSGRRRVAFLIPWEFLGGWAVSLADAQTITFETLLQEIVDRDCACAVSGSGVHLPAGEQLRPRCVVAEEAGWFANWDRSQFVRIEESDGRKEYVMLDADGPGRDRATSGEPGTDRGAARSPTARCASTSTGADEPAIEGRSRRSSTGGRLTGPPLSARGLPADRIRPARPQPLPPDPLREALQDHLLDRRC